MTTAPAAGSLRFGPTEIVLLVTTSVVWGAAYVFIRQGLLSGAAPLAFAAVRYGLAALGFVVLAAARRAPFPSRRELTVSAAVGGTLMIGLYGGFLYWGEQFTTGGYAALLASTVPLLTVAFGFVLLSSERLGRAGLVGMIVGFVGAAVLVFPELTTGALGSPVGPIFVIVAMLCATAGSVLLRRLSRGPQGLWQIGSQFAVATLLLGVACLVIPGQSALPLNSQVLANLLALVLLSSLLGYFAYFALHHRVGPTRANLVAYLAPLVGLAVGSGLYGEPFTVWEFAGVAIVLTGVTFVLWDTARRNAAPAAPRPADSGARSGSP